MEMGDIFKYHADLRVLFYYFRSRGFNSMTGLDSLNDGAVLNGEKGMDMDILREHVKQIGDLICFCWLLCT